MSALQIFGHCYGIVCIICLWCRTPGACDGLSKDFGLEAVGSACNTNKVTHVGGGFGDRYVGSSVGLGYLIRCVPIYLRNIRSVKIIVRLRYCAKGK